jgi:hypothetical protein
MVIHSKWVVVVLGVAVGLGSFAPGMHTIQTLSPISNPATNQTVYIEFKGGLRGHITPNQSMIHEFGKYGMFIGFAISLAGAQRFRKAAEPPAK